eukprot:TRINITY_DN2287_c0_g3_i21.p2 TRINITY_DN2287_c0_g3~~TRINITY_DN2287_c0_g3_i21.p2  ORF type:complete len:106 (+),score=16.82 TRINITY_DN2287_c0_g3_i21:968-1285(+)
MCLAFALRRKASEHKDALRPLEKLWGTPIEKVIKKIRTMRDFERYFTVGVQGFTTVDEFIHHASLGYKLKGIRVPTFLFSATDDPTLPYSLLTSIARSICPTKTL